MYALPSFYHGVLRRRSRLNLLRLGAKPSTPMAFIGVVLSGQRRLLLWRDRKDGEPSKVHS